MERKELFSKMIEVLDGYEMDSSQHFFDYDMLSVFEMKDCTPYIWVTYPGGSNFLLTITYGPCESALEIINYHLQQEYKYSLQFFYIGRFGSEYGICGITDTEAVELVNAIMEEKGEN